MKKLYTLLLACACFMLVAIVSVRASEPTTYYASVTGTSDAAGTMEAPLDIRSAMGKLQAGDTLKVMPGTYKFEYTPVLDENGNPTKKLNENIKLTQYGTSTNRITMENADPSQKVVFDFSNQPFDSSNRGLALAGRFWVIRGIDFTGAGDNGLYISGKYNVIENCEFYKNRDTGLQLGREFSEQVDIKDWPSNNLIKNCTSWANYDDESFGENADGFAAKLTVGYGNVFDGCIAYRNSDDGWDLYAKEDSGNIGTVFLYNCVSFENGFLPDGTVTRDGDGIGFKLGGSTMVGDVILNNCLAFNNRLHGISDNSNPGVISVSNSTCINNSLAHTKAAGEINGTITVPYVAPSSSDDRSNNFDLARTAQSYNNYKNLLSFSNIGTGADAFEGSMVNSIMHVGSNKYNRIAEYIDASSREADSKGVSYTGLTESCFASVSMPLDYDKTSVHKMLRNADGSVNMGEVCKVTSADILALGLGADLTKSSYEEYTHVSMAAIDSGKSGDELTVQGCYDVLRVITDNDCVFQDFKLPLNTNGCQITWSSSNENLVKVGTKVTTGGSGLQEVKANVYRDRTGISNVTLTATIKCGDATLTKEFPLVIAKDNPSLGNFVGLDSKYMVFQYEGFTTPEVSVTNASSDSGRLLEEGEGKDYILTTSYEYAIDKNSKFYPVSKVYTSKAGVYRITVTATSLMNASDTKSMSYVLYVASPTKGVDFVNGEYEVNLTPNGFVVNANLTNVTGYVYAYVSDNATETPEAVVLNGDKYTVTDDFIDHEFDADNTKAYYIHLVVTSADGKVLSQTYSSQVTTIDVTTVEEFYQLAQNGLASGVIANITSDLDFAEYSWVVTASTGTIKGLINGNGHTIKNLTVAAGANKNNANIFYKMTNGAMSNIKFENVRISGDKDTAARVGIIGTMEGGRISNVYMTNVSSYGLEAVGSLVGKVVKGYNEISKVSLINSDEYLIAGYKRYIGGIVGDHQADSSTTGSTLIFSDILVRANVGDNKDSGGNVGGIIGRVKNDKVNDLTTFTRCIVIGKVDTGKNYAGGILGSNEAIVGKVVIDSVAVDVVLVHGATTYRYVEDDGSETFVATVGAKYASPITGRYTTAVGSIGQVKFINCHASFADYNKEVSSKVFGFYGDMKRPDFLTNTLGLDLENVWNYDVETNTFTLR